MVQKMQIWKHVDFNIALAIDDANAMHNPNCIGGKGGIFIVINPKFVLSMTNKGIIPSGLGVWNSFNHPTIGIFGILNVYASNSPIRRIALWNELTTSIDSSISWIVVGDLNMVEKVEDQLGGSPHDLTGEEGDAWRQFTQKFSLLGSQLPKVGGLKFMWDNKRSFAPLLLDLDPDPNPSLGVVGGSPDPDGTSENAMKGDKNRSTLLHSINTLFFYVDN